MEDKPEYSKFYMKHMKIEDCGINNKSVYIMYLLCWNISHFIIGNKISNFTKYLASKVLDFYVQSVNC